MVGKSSRQLFGHIWESVGKNPLHSQKMCLLLHLWINLMQMRAGPPREITTGRETLSKTCPL